jgi:HK97 family phage prohead protease
MTIDFGREARIATGFELRRSGADSHLVSFRGYASVTDHPYDVGGGPEMGGWVETIARGAFRRTIGTGANRALLWAHDNSRVLATTRSGSLSFDEDGVGLLVDGQLDTRVSWVNDLVLDIEAGRVDEMSIGFYTRAQSWSPDYNERTITEVQLVEATIVWAGANGATVATVDRAKESLAEVRTKSVSFNRIAIEAAAAAARLRVA